jgi:hypothetical protein
MSKNDIFTSVDESDDDAISLLGSQVTDTGVPISAR